jgi:hypothetical protein
MARRKRPVYPIRAVFECESEEAAAETVRWFVNFARDNPLPCKTASTRQDSTEGPVKTTHEG